ncbi:MAG: apolipoprotein N-acyltransferase [Bacteroidota bacterium]
MRRANIVRGMAGVAVSAAFMTVAVPPSKWGPLAWVALVPLVLVIQRETPWRAGLLGMLFGVASLAGMHAWLWQLPAFNVFDAAALFGYLAVYPALWCGALAWLSRRRLPWVLPAALLWVLLDWLRSHAGPLALPWEPLAHSQVADVPLLQLAALGGAPLISLVVCLGNLAVARAWQKRSLSVLVWTAIGVTGIHLYGYFALPAVTPSTGPRVAIIQPANDSAAPAVKIELLRSLTRQVASQRPDLIVWPESAVNGFAFNPALQATVADIARMAHASILFGSADFGKFAKAAGSDAERGQFKNQAFLVSPDGSRQGPYTKNRLVPFGEFMPFERYVDWPRWLVRRQLHGIAGDSPGLFRLHDGTVFGVVICWENYFSGLADRLVRRDAAMIVQLSNDADFGASTEPAQHNAASILRAVEYGRPWLQASENGPSTFVDAHGRIVESLGPIGATRWTVRTVSLAGTTTIYERSGLLWLWLASAAALIWIALAADPRKENQHEHTPISQTARYRCADKRFDS